MHPYHHPHGDPAEFACKGSPPSRSVPFKAATGKWASTLPDKHIALLVELVSTSNLMSTVSQLASIPTRHTDSAQIQTARNWLVSQFTALGYTDVASLAWTGSGHSGHNVVCTKAATGGSSDVIILCAHYDSRMATLNNDTAVAPGADDNGSGVAAILEIARLVAGLPLDTTLRFIAFSGEEQGLLGSDVYAGAVHAAGDNIRLVINLDMVGFPPADSSVIVERDIGNVSGGNDATSLAYADKMAQAAVDYTDLPTKIGPIYASDYMPFEAQGYTVIGAYEGEGNPHYHQSSDTAATVDGAYVTKVTQMVLATLLGESLAVVSEHASTVDLYVRDSPADTGSQPSPVPHWTSPDIWVRNVDIADGDDPELGHEPPINGVQNFVYVRVHNRGNTAVPAGAATLHTFRCDPGTGMIWPTDFQSLGTRTINDAILTGGAVRVGPFAWTPQIVGHECLLAIVSTTGDHAISDVFPGPVRHDLLVRFDNNVGQRNVAPQMAVPGGTPKYRVAIRGGIADTINRWELDASAFTKDTIVTVRVPRRLADTGQSRGFAVVAGSTRAATLSLSGGTVGRLDGFLLRPGQRVNVNITIALSPRAAHLAQFALVATQHQDGQIAGKLTMLITAISDPTGYFFVNPRSHTRRTRATARSGAC